MGDDGTTDVTVTDDALGHQRFADAVMTHLDTLPTGSVLALQGSWGRGKTDVLNRVMAGFDARASALNTPKPIRIDPWRYGTPDLIKPVVLALLARIPPEGWRRDDKLRLAARTLLYAGNAMLFKALNVFAPAPLGGIVVAAKEPVDKMLDTLFSGKDDGKPVDPDPVEAMSTRFRELTERYLAHVGEEGRLLICVDDLDRCLPDHQIAMLEAIHFLTAPEPTLRCSFLVALDPALVRQAAISHYRTEGFDTQRYLDKLFTLRITLPELDHPAIRDLLRAELTGTDLWLTAASGEPLPMDAQLKGGLGVSSAQVEAAFSGIFRLPELKNPRLIHRVCDRLRLLARANALLAAEGRPDERLVGPERLDALVIWCTIADRWPELRQILQDSDRANRAENIVLVCRLYGYGRDAETSTDLETQFERFGNIRDRLPGRTQQPDLGEFLAALVLSRFDRLELLWEIDEAMVRFGL